MSRLLDRRRGRLLLAVVALLNGPGAAAHEIGTSRVKAVFGAIRPSRWTWPCHRRSPSFGCPRTELLTALFTFNLGVEAGQLTVIAVACLPLGAWFKSRPWYRGRVVVPASAAIATTGAYWTLTRLPG